MNSYLLTRLQSTLSGSYTIERELGGGGMSHVFVATEVALQRQVVLKVLPPELEGSVNMDRFRREILLAANLVHPHIVPLLASGESNGLPFYTMPFVEGKSLRAQLEEKKPPTIDQVTLWTREIAGALHYSHRRGVVHRDIKPDNVLLHDGHALVTDFGIARALSEATTHTGLTQPGAAIGTVAYMSPEQVTAESDLDGRADIYSLGCVVFEMLVGAPPFGSSPWQAVAARHMVDPVPSVRAKRPDVSEAIESAVRKALAKSPTDRFESAKAFADALGSHGAVAVPPTRSGMAPRERTIAVLPFANMSGDPSNEYFSDGIAEELIGALTRAGGMRVVARTSTFALKPPPQRDVREIGGLLNASHVLEGSIRIAGRRLRAAAQLVDAATGNPLWSERYDRDLEDVLDVQDDITSSIVGRLRQELAGIPATTPSPPAPPPRAEKPAAATPKARSTVNNCPRCGKPSAGNTKFCASCGLDISGVWGVDAALGGAVAVEMDPNSDLLGQMLSEATLGDYDIYGELGRGGVATVYLALDLALNRKVAIKTLSLDLVGRAGAAARFKGEAAIAMSLSHPHIAQVFAVSETPKVVFMVMRFIEGRSLESIINDAGPLPIDMVRVLLAQVGSALAYAHRKNVIHRDVKPANIMIDEDGWAIVTDFGLAKAQESANLTATGVAIGTPHYMSPEQFHNKSVSELSDQYALGVVAYEMLTGNKPFDGATYAEIIQKHLFDPPPDPRSVRPDVPEQAALAVMKMLSKEPADRWPGCEAAVAALGVPDAPEDRQKERERMISLAKSGPQKKVRMSVPMSPIPVQKKQSAPAATAIEPSLAGAKIKKQPKPAAAPAEKSGGAGKWIGLVILLVALGGGGWYYYANFMQPAAVMQVAADPAGQASGSDAAATAQVTDSASIAAAEKRRQDSVETAAAERLAAKADSISRANRRRDSIAIARTLAANAAKAGSNTRAKAAPAGNQVVAQQEPAPQTQQTAAPPPARRTAVSRAKRAASPNEAKGVATNPSETTSPPAGGLLVVVIAAGIALLTFAVSRRPKRGIARTSGEKSPTSEAERERWVGFEKGASIMLAAPPRGSFGSRQPSAGVTHDAQDAKLTLVSADGSVTFRITPGAPSVVGRSPKCDLTVFDPTVGRLHAELLADANGVNVKDLGSSNGTFINGSRILRQRMLVGDTVSFGKVTFTLKELEPQFPPLDARIEGALEKEAPLALDTASANPAPEARFPAYDAYLRGRFLLNFESAVSSLHEAVGQFDIAIAGNSAHAPSYAARSYARTMLARAGAGQVASLRPLAKSDAHKALELDPSLAEAHLSSALVTIFFEWDHAAAYAAIDKAIELSPSQADAHLWRGFALHWLENRPGDAIAAIERALDLDPLSLVGRVELAYAYRGQGDIEEALRQADDAIAAAAQLGRKPRGPKVDGRPREIILGDGFAPAHIVRAILLSEMGRLDEAVADAEIACKISGRQSECLGLLAMLLGHRGDTAAAAALIDELKTRDRESQAGATAIATALCGQGDWGEVFTWLRRAAELRDPQFVLVAAAPQFASVRSDARFTALLADFGIPYPERGRRSQNGD